METGAHTLCKVELMVHLSGNGYSSRSEKTVGGRVARPTNIAVIHQLSCLQVGYALPSACKPFDEFFLSSTRQSLGLCSIAPERGRTVATDSIYRASLDKCGPASTHPTREQAYATCMSGRTAALQYILYTCGG